MALHLSLTGLNTAFYSILATAASNLLTCFIHYYCVLARRLLPLPAPGPGVLPAEFYLSSEGASFFSSSYSLSNPTSLNWSGIPRRSSSVMSTHGSSSTFYYFSCVGFSDSSFYPFYLSCAYTDVSSLYWSCSTYLCFSCSLLFLFVAARTPALPSLISVSEFSDKFN